MAVVVSTLTQSERDLAAADKPILSSLLRPDFRLASKWVTGTTVGTTVSANGDDVDRPSRRLVDGLPGLRSAPNASAAAFTIVFEFFPATPLEFDWIGILNHNLDSELCTDISVQVADDGAFVTNLRTLSSRDPSGTLSANRRFADLTLIDTGIDAQRFSGVEFLRLQFTHTGAQDPEIGQVLFGRRRQLRHEPNRPWDPTDIHSNLDRFESRGGAITDVPRFVGRRRINANLNPDASPHVQDLITWFSDTNGGAVPFGWVDQPDALPDDFYMFKMEQASLEYPFVTPFVREFVLRGIEQGPSFFSQDPG